MKNRRNYYRILHVQPDAHREIIKASYRALMQKLKLHPDLGGDDWNAALLNEAYATLTNAEKRTAYDRQYLNKFRQGRKPAKQPKQSYKSHRQQAENTKYSYNKNNSVCSFCGTKKPPRSRYIHTSDCIRCNSPLEAVSRLTLAGNTRRTLQRTSLHATVRIITRPDDSHGNTATVRDLSPHGMQLLYPSRLEENQMIRIVSEILLATGRIAYCEGNKIKGKYVIGIEFITLRFQKSSGTFISESA